MFARRVTYLFLGGVVAFSAGCVQYRYGNERACLQFAENADVNAPTRAKVHVFMMDGLGTIHALEQLELGIVRAGFPKVYTAQRVDRAWFYKEIHTLHRDSADNRFVLVAQGAASKEMQRLADDLAQDDIPLDGLIFLDPVGLPVENCAVPPYPVRVIRGHQSFGVPRVAATDSIEVSNVGRSSLPCDSATQAAVIDWLYAVARSVPQKPEPVNCVPLTDEPKPIPRPSIPKVIPPAPAAWADVLCPIVGHS